MLSIRRALALLMLLLVLAGVPVTAGAEALDALFAQAAAELLTPAQEGLQNGSYALHLGETAYVPCAAPSVAPYDEPELTVYPMLNGAFTSSDPGVVAVDENGLMTGLAEGAALVSYLSGDRESSFLVTVSADAPPEPAKRMAYVARREFYETARKRLPKYNKYAKWYYGKRKEVGWCSVFTIWCANASGSNPVKKSTLKGVQLEDDAVLYLREGQVGNQYAGFQGQGRFGSVPRVGYLVIYAEMNNSYRTTHVGIVVDVDDRGDGVYRVTTVEGNMSNSVKAYAYLYDSNAFNNTVGVEKGRRLQWNMSALPEGEQTDPLVQYTLHTDHWSVFGFCESWK